VAAPLSNEESAPGAAGPAPEVWILGFLEALKRYRRVTLVGWMVAAGGAMALVLRWRSPGLLGLLDIVLSAATIAAGILLVSYGIEGLSAFIRTALAALHKEELTELRELMEEVEDGGWQDAFAALARVRRMVGHRTGP